MQKKNIVKTIRDKEYTFGITAAICSECGGEMSIPGLIDKNVQEIDEQYRAAEGLVTVEDIEKLMKIYKICLLYTSRPCHKDFQDLRQRQHQHCPGQSLPAGG